MLRLEGWIRAQIRLLFPCQRSRHLASLPDGQAPG
jgi:hypothetical protein